MSASERPLLRVVNGEPTAEEVAALVAVLTARSSTTAEPQTSRSGFADPASSMRAVLRVGPGAWVASGWVAGTRTKADW